jgi:hypothetical protein
MSSSKGFIDWTLFSEREVTLEVHDLLSPASEVGAMLQHQEATLARMQEEATNQQHTFLQTLIQQTILAYKFAVRLDEVKSSLERSSETRAYRSLRLLKDQMFDALKAAGIEIEIPLGQPYRDIEDRVNAEGWRHQKELTEETVIEVLEPIVLYQAKPVHLGTVTVGVPQLDEPKDHVEEEIEGK